MGDRQRPDGLRPLPDRLQHLGDDARGPGPARAVARPGPTSTRAGSATRAASRSTTCRADDRYAAPLVRGDRGLDEATWEAAAETVARRLRHYANLYGPGSIAVVASGEQSNEEAFAWREVVAGRRRRRARRAAAGAWELLDPYRATIADLDAADVIVIAGDREPRDLAGVIELRIRKAIRRGARLVLVGRGRRRSSTCSRASASRRHPACCVDSADAIVDRLAAAERPVLLVTDPQPLAAGRAGSRTKARARGQGGRRPAPARGAERARRSRGRLPRRSGRGPRPRRGAASSRCWCCSATPIRCRAGPHADRWRSALQRAESVVVSTLFPNEATGWAHVILPATATLEKEGSTTNLEGRVQRLRPTLPPPGGRRLASSRSWASWVASSRRRCRPTRRPSTAGSPPPSPALRPAGRRPPLRARRRVHAAKGSSSLARGKKADGGARRRCRIVAYRPLISGPAVDRAERLALPASRARSCSRTPTPSGSASPRASRWSSRTPAAGRRGPLAHLAHARRQAPCACRGRARPVSGAATVEAEG